VLVEQRQQRRELDDLRARAEEREDLLAHTVPRV
jgi:hypothetical protein